MAKFDDSRQRTFVRRLIVSGLLAVSLAFASRSDGQTTAPAPTGMKGTWSRGAILHDFSKGSIELRDVLREAAPALWFSPNEPLLFSGVTNAYTLSASLPVGLPPAAPSNVVYVSVKTFEITRKCQPSASPSGRTTVPLATLTTWLVAGCETRLVIRYMFYYPQDIGLGSHPHDLEAVDVTVREDVVGGSPILRISNVAASAHGIGWYSNELEISPETPVMLPVRILVEEGKHASVPDRNGDGAYTPHYDVNAYVTDAWGIRDNLSSSYLPGVVYEAGMAKRRTAETLRFPARRMWAPAADEARSNEDYQLEVPASTTYCSRKPGTVTIPDISLEEPDRLKALLIGKDFCAPWTVTLVSPARESHEHGLLVAILARTIREVSQFVSPSFGERRPFGRYLEKFSYGWRHADGDDLFVVSLPYKHVPVIDGWLVLRASSPIMIDAIVGDFSLLYTRSASRIVDWYVGESVTIKGATSRSGPTYERLVGNVFTALDATVFPITSPMLTFARLKRDGSEIDAHLATEAGLKVRFPLKEEWRIPMVGFRIGVRASDVVKISRWRLIVEAGLGAW